EFLDYDSLTINPSGQPDLIGTHFDAIPDPSAWNDPFSADWEVMNQGTVDAGAFDIGWYLSLDTDYDLGDPIIGYTSVVSLAAGTSTSGIEPLTMIDQTSLPIGWPTSGPYYIVMFTDDMDNVTESDETNNHGTGFLDDYDDIYISDGVGEVDVHLVPRIVPSASDTSATLPTSDTDTNTQVDHAGGTPFWQRETCDYYIEVWVRSDQANPDGISGGSVDILFDPQYTEAISVDHGTIFTILPIENIDNVSGIVSIGGGTMATDMGDDEFVLLGRILFHGDAPVDEVAHQAGPYDTSLNVTDGPTDFALVGAGNVDADFQAVPTVDIRANIFDIDDSGQVDFGDFSYFVPAFLHNVGDPEPPYVWWADFDESGQVNFGDFSYFVTAFMKSFCDYSVVFPGGRVGGEARFVGAAKSPLAGAADVLLPAPALGVINLLESSKDEARTLVAKTGGDPTDGSVSLAAAEAALPQMADVLAIKDVTLPFTSAGEENASGVLGKSLATPVLVNVLDEVNDLELDLRLIA
ncbi:MAG: hypothetical protein KAV00_00700, partial [Phycisphaerae bacterium]|nr:hypothetical protein [Phycisphaerae bacterium]